MSSDVRVELSTRLWVILALQVAVIALLYGLDRHADAPETGSLLDFDTDAVDGLVIEESGATSLRLERNDAGWRLDPASETDPALAADADKIIETLDKLAGLSAPWPVATSASARTRFEVADDKYQRAVHLEVEGKPVASLLLGTSPGFRRLHVRKPGDDRIFEVDLAHFDFSVNADDWIDRAVLAASGDVRGLERIDAWQMTLNEGAWSLASETLADAATPAASDSAPDSAADSTMAQSTPPAIDATKVSDLVTRFANLRILGAASATPPGEPQAVFAVTDAKGTQRLSFFRVEGAPEVTVTSDRHPGAFRVATFVAEQLLVDRAGLLAAPEAAPAAADAGGPSE
jgi:hypothetical protein